jgi:hypothetical protein
VEDPKDYSWCGYARAVAGEMDCVRGITALWGRGRGVSAALAEHRAFLFEEGAAPDGAEFQESSVKFHAAHASQSEGKKARKSIDAKKVWEERQRGGRLPLHVLLRLRSRYLVDGAVIGRAEFVRRVTGGSAAATAEGKPGKKMRFGAWGGLHALRDLRVNVVG